MDAATLQVAAISDSLKVSDNPSLKGSPSSNGFPTLAGQATFIKPGAKPLHALPVFLALAAVLAIAFAPTGLTLWRAWTEEHSPFGFGYFVPPSIAYLIWVERSRLKVQPLQSGPAWAWLALALLTVVQAVGVLASVNVIQSAALIGVILVAPVCIWGVQRVSLIWPYLLFAVAMIPWPGELINPLLVAMQRLSIDLAALILSAVRLHPAVDGVTVTLPKFVFDVAPACAGLTVLFPMIASAVFTAFMIHSSYWRKLVFIALAVPISIVTNAGRIALVGVIGNSGGAALANRLHDSSGLFGVLVGVVVLTAIGNLIGCGNYLPKYMPAWAIPPNERDPRNQTGPRNQTEPEVSAK